MTEITNNRALIAMSGGVDSSMAAKLMLDRGYSCIGCTMQLYDHDLGEDPQNRKTCCSLTDIDDARRVCGRIGIPHQIVNYKEEFREKIMEHFVAQYEQGLTPNPCIDCNNLMKFGLLFRKADELDCRYIVTGHYARIEEKNGIFHLKKALDPAKDQSYFLYGIPQERMKRILFPLGEYTKEEIRSLADGAGFVNAAKHDSQDICFVPDGDYASMIRTFRGHDYPEGDFTDREGRILGRHKGIIGYTIGQRRGLGISAEAPYYVCDICPENNTVILGSNDDLFHRELTVSGLNWITGTPAQREFRCKVRIRYRHAEQDAVVSILSEDRIKVTFDEPQRAITKGQSAVLYDEDEVLGGGIICS